MSQLNPNAAEFVPVSPTRSIPSPACRLMHDPVIAQSPKRPSEIDINLPNPQDFEKEVKSRPSDFDSFSNGHDHEGDQKSPTQELMENVLNGKNIDEIPEFQPGNTPSKVTPGDEFHFGPNAAPFTPVKLLDQSEAALSTKAVYGDESIVNLDSTLDTSRDNVDFSIKQKEDDPMSMSFYQDKSSGDADPFDLNKVQILPENLEDFLNKPDDNIPQQDIISEHDPARDVVSDEIILNNDERIQTTDLDKVDDEKELASPASNDDESSGVCELSKSPRPQTDDLLCQLECNLPREILPDVCLRPQTISPQPVAEELNVHSPEPELLSLELEAESPAEPALSPEPVTESPAIQAFSPEPAALSPLPPTLSPAPQAISPAPEALSPVPQQAPVLSPEPQERDFSREPQAPVLSPEPQAAVPLFEPQTLILSPEPQAPVLSPEPQEQILSLEPETTVPESFVSKTLSPEPAEDICKISKSPLLEAASPEPSELVCSLPKSLEPEKVRTLEPEQLIETANEAVTEDMFSFGIDERKELPVESPIEDITSSVKDVSSPIGSPIPDQVEPDPNILLNFAQEINNAVQSTVAIETSSPIRGDEATPDVCPLSTPKSVTDTESVATTDVNSFLERSEIVDLTSPLSQGETTFTTEHPLSKCVYPLPTEIETETITPEFAEPVVISPTETKDETPSVPSFLEETVKEPEVAAKEPAPVVAAVGAAVAATVAAAAAATVAEKKPTKAKAPFAVKKTAAKSAASPTTKPAPSPTKAKATPTAKAKPFTTRTTPTTAKTTTSAAASKPPIPRAASKPKTPTTATPRTSLEKKPLANGDVKAPLRTSLTSRRSTEGAKPPTPKASTTTLHKAMPTKPPAPRPTTAPTKTAAAKPASTATTLKPRPTTLASRTTTSTAATSRTTTSTVAASRTVSSTTTTAKLGTSKTAASPKVSSPPKPRPSTAPAKPKVPATRTVTKTSTDTEKQNKDSANKLTASRTVTSTRTTGTASSKTLASTARRTESKVSGATRTTVTKTTTTTTRPGAAGKKPLEITRTGSKTKTTKIEKPVQNGVTTVVTEQITIVNNAVVNDSDTQLMKDNSPIDNKLLVDTNVAD